MLTQNDTTALAVRLFENKTYGTTHGKGLYRRALYNGTIDIKTPVVKYIIDLFPYQEWAHQARTDAQIVTLESITQDSNVLFSWIQRYDFLRVIAQSLYSNSPGGANMDKATLHIGAIAFIHQFGFIRGLQHFIKPSHRSSTSRCRVAGWGPNGNWGWWGYGGGPSSQKWQGYRGLSQGGATPSTYPSVQH